MIFACGEGGPNFLHQRPSEVDDFCHGTPFPTIGKSFGPVKSQGLREALGRVRGFWDLEEWQVDLRWVENNVLVGDAEGFELVGTLLGHLAEAASGSPGHQGGWFEGVEALLSEFAKHYGRVCLVKFVFIRLLFSGAK